MENFLYSLNATIPIFLLIILGKVLMHFHIINSDFTKTADRLVFYVGLPALVFRDLGMSSVKNSFHIQFVLFCAAVTIFIILAIWFLTDIFMKDKESQGAFIQASYRSSAAILGMAFINNMYGDAGNAPLMIIGAVPFFNIFAVIILTLKGKKNEKKSKGGALLRSTIIDVMKNPILISIVVSIPFAVWGIRLPSFAEKTISNLAGIATPLALICIGAGFEGRKAIKKIKPTAVAAFIKLILLASLFLPLAIYLGFRNQELVAALIMLASPATPSCYIMVKNTNNDAVLTSSIIVLTTLLSSVTLTGWIYLLRSFGFI